MKTEKLILAIGMVVLAAILMAPLAAYSIQFQAGLKHKTEPDFAATRLIVKLKPEANENVILGRVQSQVTTGLVSLDRLNLKFRVSRQERLFRRPAPAPLAPGNLSGVYVLEVPAETDLQEMKAEYESNPEVEYAEPDYTLELYETPDDPLFPHQWWLNNLGAAQNDGQGYYGNDRTQGHDLVVKFGVEDADIDWPEAMGRDDQTTIPLVGIIDTGVDTDHEDLAGHVWINPGEIPNNGLDDDHNGFTDDLYGWDFSGDSTGIQEDNDPSDSYGHGTHCAGIVAAVSNNGIGIAGVSAPCRVMAIKIFPNAYASLGAEGIVYAADMGCDVINMSWGAAYPSRLMKDALDYAMSKEVLPVAAAGNDGAKKLNYPAAYDGILTVGASNSEDEVTDFSTYGEHVEVIAPGQDILSLRAAGTDMYAEDGFPGKHVVDERYYLADGTSMAAPCVAGVAAYLLAVSPGVSVQTAMEMIQQSAEDVVYPYGGDSLYSPGRDVYSGYGRVNLNSALQLISGRMARIDYPFENALVSGEVAVMGTASGTNFESYLLEYGEGLVPDSWNPITSSVVPVTGDTLGVWNSSALAGLFTLRLTVGDQNQTRVRVIADNHSYVRITSPTDADTVAGFAEIRGYTIAPGFSEYRLEYGYGESPASWFPIITSTKMVADGTLGRWLVSFLNVGEYSLRLLVQTSAGGVYADTVALVVRSIAISGCTQELLSNGSLSPAVGDVDGDGYDEIVVGVGSSLVAGRTGGVEVFTHDCRREPGWPKDTDRNMMSSPSLGDLDGDGIKDIVICSDAGVHAYLSDSPAWLAGASTQGSDFWGLATPIIADLEEDGEPEVLTISANGQVYAWHADGQPFIPGTQGKFALTVGSTPDMDFPCLAVADLDGDGENEVIAGAAHPVSGEYGNYQGVGGIYIWDLSGNSLLEPGDYPIEFVYVSGIAVADVDHNEDLEILVFSANGNYHTICALKKDGTQAAGYPILLEDVTAGWWFGNHPAVGDLDGDGSLEIVVSLWTLGEARIYAWHQDGTPLVAGGPLVSFNELDSERNREIMSVLGGSIGEIATRCRTMNRQELAALGVTWDEDPFTSQASTFGSPVLADMDGNGSAEIVIRAGHFLNTGYEKLYAWDYEAMLLPGFPLYATAEPNFATYYPYTPVVADVDRDGKVDLILNTDFNIYAKSKVISWELDAEYVAESQPWPKYMHDIWNSGKDGFRPPQGGMSNSPPANFHVKSWSDTSAILGWTPRAPWATLGYNIYRTTVSGQPGEKLNVELIPQPDSQYQDIDLNAGQTYYYAIASVNHDWVESERSPEVGVTAGGPTTPDQPWAQVEQGMVTLTWLASSAEQGVREYRIYHKTPSCDGYYLVSSTSETTFVDSTLKEVGGHSYRVSAVDSTGLESHPSAAVIAQVETVGSPPHYLKTSSWLGGEVTLSWRVSQGGQGCWVYRSTIPGVYGDPPLNAQPIDDPYGWEINYRDSGLTEGVTYYYVVTQIQGEINTSPSNRADYLAGMPQAIINVSGEVRDCHVVVHWNRSEEGDVVKYRIYDGIGHGGDIVLVDSVEHDTIYVDPAVEDSVKHYFWITAVDSLGFESPLPLFLDAEPARVTGPLYPPEPPEEFKIVNQTDTSLTFSFVSPDPYACNIYRGTSSGEYHDPPINPTPIPSVFPRQYVYRFTDMVEAQDYFFNATCVKENECGTSESRMNQANQVTFVLGTPEPVTGLAVELNEDCHGVLTWRPSTEGDLIWYNIYRLSWPRDEWNDFQIIDSVRAPNTTYLDASLDVVILSYRYTVTAVDSFGLEGPILEKAMLHLGPAMPEGLQVTDFTDTSVTLEWYRPFSTEHMVGANVYRSMVSNHYLGLDPINDTLVLYDAQGRTSYTDFDVQEGVTYYYTATNVNVCGLQSPPYNYEVPTSHDPLEDTVLAGVPHQPHLEVRSGRENVLLQVSTSDTDIKGYKVFRKQRQGDFRVIEPLLQDSVYTDLSTVIGLEYLYRVTAIDTFDLESDPSAEIPGCLMPLDLGILLVDLTRGIQSTDGVNGDSVNAFYHRALGERQFAYIDRGLDLPLSLIDLSRYSVAILYSEDCGSDISAACPILKQYVDAGGAVLIEGRGLLSRDPSDSSRGYQSFPNGDFRHEFLNIDSAWIPVHWSEDTRNEEFVEAKCTSPVWGYPEKAELDTFRVNHAYDPLWFDLEGKLPGVGFFVPLDPSEVIYTFNSAYDTSCSGGKAAAVRHFTESTAAIYIGFPLWFVKEDIATRILHRALEELLEFANRSTRYFGYAPDLTKASVFPNPFKPFQGHHQVTFDGLTAQATIEVYTITGEKVCTIEELDGDGQVVWNVTNARGNKLASGVYIYRITDGQGREKVSKLAVIR